VWVRVSDPDGPSTARRAFLCFIYVTALFAASSLKVSPALRLDTSGGTPAERSPGRRRYKSVARWIRIAVYLYG